MQEGHYQETDPQIKHKSPQDRKRMVRQGGPGETGTRKPREGRFPPAQGPGWAWILREGMNENPGTARPSERVGAVHDRNRMTIARWSFSGELTESLWTRGSARDHHDLRALVFEDNCRSRPMIAGEVKTGYALTDHLSVFGSLMFQKYFESKAATTTTGFSTGTVSHDPGEVAGMDHCALLFNLGLKWAF